MRYFKNVAVILLVLLTTSCGYTPLLESDTHYLLLPEDFSSKVFSNYKIKTDFKGKPYIFVKSKSPLNEFGCGYSVQYYGKGDTIINYQVMVSITNTEGRARTHFNNLAIEKGLFKDHLIKIANSEYDCTDIMMICKNDYLRLIILKNRIVYTITIENMSVSELDFRPTLRKKLEYLNDLVRFNKI